MKLKKILVIASCLLISAAFAFQLRENPKREKDADKIPIQVLYGLPLAKVAIQEEVLQLIVDLGSHSSALSKEAMEKLHLTKLQKNTYSMDLYGQRFTEPVFSASNVRIGNYSIADLEFSKAKTFNADFEPNTPKELTYGKIGREPFLDKALFIDRKKGLCVIKNTYPGCKIDPRRYEEGTWMETSFNLSKEKGISLFLVTDTNEEKEVILDTGTNVSIISKPSIQQAPLNLQSDIEKITLKLQNGVSLGTFSFYPFDCTNVGLEGILGFDFFDHYIVCLDFVNKKMFLKRYE